jgi:nicotinate-nucleotide adenylyltransferase
VERLGILGGTFNPPHLGHLAVARCAREELGLDRVLLMPARIPPHKGAEADPGPEHRLRMCRLAVDGAGGLSVCAQEIERRGPSYTVDTLEALHARHPPALLTFILGADTAGTLPAWREPARVLALAELAVAARSGVAREEVLATLAPLIGAADDGGDRDGSTASGRRAAGVRFLDMPLTEISSSTARERAARGEPIVELVGRAVADYIGEHDLYRRATGAEG